jgi:hypothetical protein
MTDEVEDVPRGCRFATAVGALGCLLVLAAGVVFLLVGFFHVMLQGVQ